MGEQEREEFEEAVRRGIEQFKDFLEEKFNIQVDQDYCEAIFNDTLRDLFLREWMRGFRPTFR